MQYIWEKNLIKSNTDHEVIKSACINKKNPICFITLSVSEASQIFRKPTPVMRKIKNLSAAKTLLFSWQYNINYTKSLMKKHAWLSWNKCNMLLEFLSLTSLHGCFNLRFNSPVIKKDWIKEPGTIRSDFDP